MNIEVGNVMMVRGKGKMQKSKITLLLILFGIMMSGLIVSGAGRPQTYHLTIFHVNDIHGHELGNLARQATVIRETRMKEPNVLALNAGDVFTKGKYQHQFYGELEFALLNAMGTDALTLGNNEFKATNGTKAPQYLYARIDQARFPVLCANVLTVKDGSYLSGVKPYIVLNIHGVKIGILGIVTNEVGGYNQAKGFQVLDPIATAQEIYPKLARQADIVLALTHIGYKRDRDLAKAVPGLAAIVGGHSHTLLMNPKPVGNIPIVQAGAYGKYLGRLDLYFENTGQGWRLKRF
jgi:2',3'-cyclic-nucleotide 2'-phosphodiesterase (5'-nucleotidase family)